MARPHVIRLRGPWELVRVTREGADAAPLRVDLEADWRAVLGENFRGRLRAQRRFHAPTNLEPHQRVFLAWTLQGREPAIDLNGQRLAIVPGQGAAQQCEITAALAADNRLSIEFTLEDLALSPPLGDVCLQIEE